MKGNGISSVLRRLFSFGNVITEPEDVELNVKILEMNLKRERKIMISTVVFIIVFLFIYGMFAIFRGNVNTAVFDFVSALLMMITLVFYIKNDLYEISRNIMTTIIFLVFLYLFFGEGIKTGSYLWTLTFPIYTIFFLKTRSGLNVSILFYLSELFIYLTGISYNKFSLIFIVRYSGVYMAIVLISYIIERTREENILNLLSINSRLNETIKKFSRSQQALSASEKKYRDLVEKGNEGILIIRDEKILYSNPQFCRMAGLTEKRLKKAGLKKILSPGNFKELKKFLSKSGGGNKSSGTFTTVIRDRQGNSVDIEIKKTSLEYLNSRSDLLFIRDISLRKKFEREKIKFSKMETFRAVSDGITHDFNNLLTIIMGNVELAKLNISESGKLKANLDKIEDTADRAGKLIKQFLTFSSDATLVMSKEYLQDIIPGIPELHKEPGISFDMKIADELWPVRCDREKIIMAINNIVLNGIDAMDGKGVIKIECSNVKDISKYRVQLEDSLYVALKITDDGKGIPKKNIKNIFEPYFSTKKSVTQKGMGLGLTIANGIILNHKGAISVISRLNKGSTFTVFLPAEP